MTYYGEANYYELLEIAPRAARADIDRAYRQQMMLLSGDSLATYGLFVGDDLLHARTAVEEAYRVLTDPERRRAYDLSRFSESVVSEADVARAVAESGLRAARSGGADSGTVESGVGSAGGSKTIEAATDLKSVESRDVVKAVEAAPAAPASPASAPGSPLRNDRSPASPPPSVTFRRPSPAADAANTAPPTDAPRPVRPETPPRLPASRPTEPQVRPALPGWRNPVPEARPEGGVTVPPARPARPAPRVALENFDGPSMRAAREQQGIARTEIATRTRIGEYYIEAIEKEEFKKLPPEIYLRGYLRQYAEAIGVDPDRAVTEFLARYNDARGASR